ncbi:MAG TPA: hypothetical protein VE084_24560, partial [Burkholderiaceae bacterium]|nr:hypothetical protein [Burkholderiaceae bacterium]
CWNPDLPIGGRLATVPVPPAFAGELPASTFIFEARIANILQCGLFAFCSAPNVPPLPMLRSFPVTARNAASRKFCRFRVSLSQFRR